MDVLIYTDRETSFRFLHEVPFELALIRHPLAVYDKKTVERALAAGCPLAVVDLDLPDGETIRELIRSRSPETRIVSLSAAPSEESFCCRKPVTATALLETLRLAGADYCRETAYLPRCQLVDHPEHSEFWTQFLQQNALTDTVLIRRTAVRCGLPTGEDTRYTLVRIGLYDRLQFDQIEWHCMTDSVRNALTALVAVPPLQPETLIRDEAVGLYWLVLRQEGRINASLLQKRCTLFAKFCENFYCHAECCYMPDRTIDDFRGAADQIRLVYRDAGPAEGWIHNAGTYRRKNSGYCSAEFIEKFRRILPDDGVERFMDALRNLLDDYQDRGVLDYRLLLMMRPDLDKLLREALAEKQLDVLSLMEDPYCLELLPHAHFSRDNMIRYIRSILKPVWNKFPASVTYPEPVQRIIEWLDENLTVPYSREALGRAIGLNPNYLAALFKESTGYSISTYRGMRQMEKAARLLSDTRLPVAAVAEQTGYSDSTYFCNAFRKQHGISPTEYRKRHGS